MSNHRAKLPVADAGLWCVVIAAAWLAWGCESGGMMVGSGSRSVPANAAMAQKISIGQLVNEAGLNDKDSTLRKLAEGALAEARQGGWQDEQTRLLETLLNLDATGLDTRKPVQIWLRFKTEHSEESKKLTAKRGEIRKAVEAGIVTQETADKILAEYRQEILGGAAAAEPMPQVTLYGGATATVKNMAVVEEQLTILFRADEADSPTTSGVPALPAAGTDGADNNATDNNGTDSNPLPWVERNGYKTLVTSMAERGPSANSPNHQSLLIGLNRRTLIFIVSGPYQSNGPDLENLIGELLTPTDRAADEQQAINAANEHMLSLLDTPATATRFPHGLARHLRATADFGAYFSLGEFLGAYPEDMLRSEEPFASLLRSDPTDPASGFFTLDQLKQSHASLAIDSRPGALQATLAAGVPSIAADWQGKGLDSTLLNAVPADAALVAGLSLGKGLKNLDSIQGVLPLLENIAVQQRLTTFPLPKPETEACIVDDALSGLSDLAKEFAAEKLLGMFEGTAFVAVTFPPAPAEEPEEPVSTGAAVAEPVEPPVGFVAGFKIADPDLFTQIKGALRAGGILREAETNGIFLVHRGDHAFICTSQYREELEKSGRLKDSIAGNIQRQLRGKAFVLWSDHASLKKNGEAIGWESAFDESDAAGQALEAAMQSLLFSINFTKGHAEANLQIDLSDPDMSGLRQWIEAALKAEEPPAETTPSLPGASPDDNNQ